MRSTLSKNLVTKFVCYTWSSKGITKIAREGWSQIKGDMPLIRVALSTIEFNSGHLIGINFR